MVIRNRRLAGAVAVFAVLALLAAGAYTWRQQDLNKRALAARDNGLAAYEASDYLRALDQIGRYLQRYGQENDPDALYRYADARSRVPMPNGKHIPQAIGLMRLAVERKPGFDPAERRLLELYLEAGFGQETLTLAARMRDRNPDDVDALRAEAVTLARLQRYEEALECAGKLAESDPTDLQNHLLALSLLQRTGADDAAIRAYAEERIADAPGEPRMEVVRAAALEMTGDRAGAAAAAERAAENPGTDAEFIVVLEKLLDRLDRFDAALALLERAVDSVDDPAIRRSYVQRLYERGDWPVLIETASAAPPAEQDSTVLAFHAMAAAQSGAPADCAALVDELERRAGDPEAETWAPVLRIVFADQGRAPADVAAACRAALTRNPDNPHFHHLLALAYERLGETSQAIGAWQSAIRLAPAWNEPIIRAAAALAAIDRQEEATRFALEALNRAPANPVSAAKCAAIIGADLDGLAPGNEARLLELVGKIHEAIPAEPATLALYVDMLCRAGMRDDALARAEAALAASPAPPPGALLQLARVSDKHGLELADRCYAAAANAPEAAPELALARALKLRDAGDPEAGAALLQSAAAAARGGVEWRLVRARYLEAIGAENAAAEWAAIADGAPENPVLQKAALAAPSAWSDHGLIGRIVERLQTAAGEDGVSWREAKARLLLASDPSEKAAAEATVLLNDVLRTAIPRVQHYTLMATALERLNNPRGAAENLEKAIALDPDSNGLLIELARLSMIRGERGRSLEYLAEALRSPQITEPERRRAAAILASQNEGDRAAGILLASYDADEKERPADLLLAEIYLRSGRVGDAETVARNALAAAPSGQAAAFLADVLAAQGRLEEARAELAALESVEPNGAVRAAIHAEFERRYGDGGEAETHYRAAAVEAGANPVLWRRYIAYVAARGRLADAAGLIDEAQRACPGDAGFIALANAAELFRAVEGLPMAPAFAAAAVDSPASLADATAALETLRDAPSDDREALAIQLKQLADRAPRFLPVQVQLVRLYGALGRRREAAALAAQTLAAFPGSEEAARLAAEAHAADGNWAEAYTAAMEWRRRSTHRTAAADALAAEALVRTERYGEALDLVAPYIESAADPGAYSPFHALRVQALIGQGRVEEAENHIAARVTDAPEWRMAAARIAANSLPDAAAAARWLALTEKAIPADSNDERASLASACFAAGERLGADQLRAQARTILDDLARQPDPGPRTWLSLALVADRQGDAAAAESAYRRALESDPRSAIALNNLAMLLIGAQRDAQEAFQLAAAAVDINPNNPSFLDTLAQAAAAVGDFDAAVANLEKASNLEPGETKWAERREAMANRQRAADPAS